MKKALLTILVSLISLSAQESSTTNEKVNPFNEFIKPEGGVNLFSGDVAFPLDLIKLPGRNGMDISVTLRYSSNVNSQARAKNDVNPTGWVGLGWGLGFGSIICDHKNTMLLDDDKYYWLSAEGVRKEIIDAKIKDQPFWKVDKIVDASGYKIKGWILTDINGKKYIYGNPYGKDGDPDPQLATRVTFCWPSSKYVGEGFGGTMENYPFQWDLSKIVDRTGNEITFLYDTTAEPLKCTISSDQALTKLYTKASYLKQITNPQGDRIVFETEDKDKLEYMDNQTFKEEPDNFIEFYETKKLKSIKLYSANDLVKTYSFCYKLINVKPTENYAKSLLQSITETNKDSKKNNQYRFEYYEETSQIGKDNYNFGAIDKLVLPRCGSIEYFYKQQYVSDKMARDPSEKYDDIKVGRLNNGKEYCVGLHKSTGGGFYDWDSNNNSYWYDHRYTGDIEIKIWDGVKWTTQQFKITDMITSDLEWDGNYECSASGEFFIVTLGKRSFYSRGSTKGKDEHQVFVYSYNPRIDKFEKDTAPFAVLTADTQGGWPKLAIGDDYLVIYSYLTYNDIDQTASDRTRYYRFNQKTRRLDYLDHFDDGTDYNPYGNYSPRDDVQKQIVIPGKDFFISGYQQSGYIGGLIRHDIVPKVLNFRVYRYLNGLVSQPITLPQRGGINFWAGPNYLLVDYDVIAGHWLCWYNWNGEEWVEPNRKLYLDESIFEANTSENYFEIAHNYDDISIFHWTGEEWYRDEKQLRCVNFNAIREQKVGLVFGTARYNLFGETHTRKIDHIKYGLEEFGLYNWNNYNNRWNINKCYLTLDEKVWKSLAVGDGFAVGSMYKNRWKNWQWQFKLGQGIWDGDKLNQKLLKTETADDGTRIENPIPYAIGNSVFVQKSPQSNKDNYLFAFRKIGDDLSDRAYVYACTLKVVNDGVTGKINKSKYLYTESRENGYNTISGSAEFAKVTVVSPDTTENYYHTGVVNPFEGMVKQVIRKNSKGLVISKETMTYSEYQDPLWDESISYKYLSSQISYKDGSKSQEVDRLIDPINGLDSIVVTKNSDGTRKIAKTTYTHDLPYYSFKTKLLNYNLLSDVAQYTIYKKISGNDFEPNKNEAVSSVTSTYKYDDILDTYEPENTFVWHENTNTNGLPDFDFGQTQNDPEIWRPQNSNDEYNKYGSVTEIADGNDNPSVIFYGFSGSLPVAQVKNSRLNDCAILTGDYDDGIIDNSTNYIDFTNNWEENGCTIGIPPKYHFGDKAIHISTTGKGPRKELEDININTDYIFSAWVYPVIVSTDKPVKFQVIKSTTGSDPITKDVNWGELEPGKWNFISRVIPKSELTDLTETDNIAISVTSGNGAEFYLEDIRFHPVDALVSTTYYHQLYKQPVTMVDPNNASKHTSYDEFGQVAESFKRDNAGNETILSKNEYDYMICNTSSLNKQLATLTASAGNIGFTAEKTSYALSVDNSLKKISLAAVAANPDAKLGISAPTITGYTLDCPCGLNQEIPLLDGATTPVTISVLTIDGGQKDYTVNLKRLTNCWLYSSENPVADYSSPMKILKTIGGLPYVAYIDKNTNKTMVKYLLGSDWQITGGTTASINDINKFEFGIQGSSPYIAFDETYDENNIGKLIVRKFSGTVWQDVGGYASASTINAIKMAFNGTTPFVSYTANKNAELSIADENYIERIFVKRYDGTSWVPATPSTSGIVAEEGVSDYDFAVLPTGEPIIAYVYKSELDDATNDPKDGLLYVKKLVGQTWTDLGTAVSDGAASKVYLAMNNTDIYISYAEELSAADLSSPNYDKKTSYKIRVKKYISGSWEDVSSSQSAVAFMSDDDHFELKIKENKPFLFITNVNNAYKTTAVQFDGTNWVTFGNPSFAPSVHDASKTISGDIASDGTPYLVFDNSYQSGKPYVMQYTNTCPDVNLSSIMVTSGSTVPLVPEFRQYITNYSARVSSTTGSVTISVQTRGNADVSINDISAPSKSAVITLNPGENKIPITVISQDDNETQITYFVTITRPLSSYASLCDFDVFSGNKNIVNYTPAFNPNTFIYSANVNYDIPSIQISPTNSNNSHITVSNMHTPSGYLSAPITLNYGVNKIPIEVTAPDGVTSVEYDLNVTRSRDPSLPLTNLTISGVPSFYNQDIFDYKLSVISTVSEVTVTPTAANVDISVNDQYGLISGSPTSPIKLSYGINYINVVIKSLDGSKKAVYSIQLTRQPSNDVKLSALSFPGITPSFDGTKMFYTADAASDVSSITIHAIPLNSQSTVKINGEPVPGSGNINVDLNSGINMVEVEVTKQDGSESAIYLLKISRALENKTPEIAFENTEIKKSESLTNVKIPVYLTSTPTTNVSVHYSVTGGTATRDGTDKDYILEDGDLTFEPCEAEKDILLTVIDDDRVEKDETIVITLSSPNGAILGDAKVLTYTILDNDLPKVSFASRTSTVNKSAPSHNISIKLSENPTKPVVVAVGVTGGAAVNGTDYRMVNNTVIFNSGDLLTKDISLDAFSNGSAGNKTVVLDMLNAQNAEYGDFTRHTINIIDDNAYTVTFDAQGGTPVPASQSVSYNSHVSEPSPEPTRTGYGSPVWCSDAEGKNPWDFSSDVVTGDITLYAKWNQTGYTLTTNAENGTIIRSPYNRSYPFNAIVTINAVPEPGFRFTGWSGDVTGTNPIITVTMNNNKSVTANFVRRRLYVNNNIDYVSPEYNNGSSWRRAFSGPGSLDRALDEAEALGPSAGDEVEIWVAANGPETMPYVPTRNYDSKEIRRVAFWLRPYVKMYGGFKGVDESETVENRQMSWEKELGWRLTNETILSGDLAGDDHDLPNNGTHPEFENNAFNVVIAATNDATIDGFTIQNGNADDDGLYFNGGGIDIFNASPIVSNCTFINNRANRGGGISNQFGNPIIENCRFYNNEATEGGAIINYNNASCLIDKCFIIGNSALPGGGVCTYFNANQTMVIQNSLINWNYGSNGSGIFINGPGNANILNCTIAHNYCNGSGRAGIETANTMAGATIIKNTIFYENTVGEPYEIYSGGVNTNISYSDIYDSKGNHSWNSVYGTDGGHNIYDEPSTGWEANDFPDYRLPSGSPCIDKGTDSNTPITDILGNSRIDIPYVGYPGTLRDIGAYENQGP